MKTKNEILSMMQAFVNRRPGFDGRNYNSRANYLQDYLPVLADKKHFTTLCNFILASDITAADIIKASESAFSGRLTITDDGIEYCTGQYYPTEYRLAACAVLAAVIWYYLRDQVPETVENKGDYLRDMCKARFGRKIQQRFFN